jgi:hypothetical protein
MSATPETPMPAATQPAWTPPVVASAPKPMATMAIVAVVVIVVVAAIVGGLYATHSGPFHANGTGAGNGASSSGSGETYSQAAAAAQPATSSVAGGPWSVAGGVGVVISSAITVNSSTINASFGGGLCNPVFLSSDSSLSSIPSTSTTASAGLTNAWVVIFSNAAAGVLEVAVFGGVATPILTIAAYGSCGLAASAVTLPGAYVNSPAAALTAFNEGGSAFVAAHTSYNLEEVLVPTVTATIGGHVTTTGASWEISYTDCNIALDDGSTFGDAAPAQFLASVNATTGAWIRGFNTTNECPSLNGGGGTSGKNTLQAVTEAFVFSQQHTSKTAYWNNGSLVTTLSALTAGDLVISIENNTTGVAVSTTGMTLEIVNITLVTLSAYNFGTNTWSAPSVSIGVSGALNVFSLSSTSSLKGDKIVITATSAAPATGSESAPLGKS